MERIILHVDMDAFFASVEMRDHPSLKGKPLIIGSLPRERGVVATCNYEARKYGVHSAMNIKEAYRLCPNGVYMHGNYDKYKRVSHEIHKIWDAYATKSEAVALDEAYLDITAIAKDIWGARKIAKMIKHRILEEIGLTCSIGIGYCKIAAKTASEEKKPNGYYEILSKEEFVQLVKDRDVSELYTVGKKTAKKLNEHGIYKICDIQHQKEKLVNVLGNRGAFIYNLSYGIDSRELREYKPEDAQSMSREVTFQKDVDDFEFLKDVLFLLALCVENQTRKYGLHGNGVSLKITYYDMKTITRSRLTYSCDFAIEMQRVAISLLQQIDKKPIRLIGIGVYHLTKVDVKQLSFDDFISETNLVEYHTKQEFDFLKNKYHLDFENNQMKLNHMETFFRTIEYMRKRSYNKNSL